MACHVPLRVYVMGDRAEKTATPEELARMRALVAEAVDAGAVGLSTSRTLLHRDLEGTVVPGTYADRVELTELMAGLAQGGGGLFEMVQDFADHEVEMDWITTLSAAFGVPVSFGFGPGSDKRMQEMFELLEHANETAGANVTGQVAVKIQGVLQNIESKFHPFVGHPTYVKEVAPLPVEERQAKLQDPEIRAQMLSEESGFGDAPFARSIFNPGSLYILDEYPDYEQHRDRLVNEMAKSLGISAHELMYDALADGKTMVALGSGPKDGRAPLDRTRTMLTCECLPSRWISLRTRAQSR